MKTDARTARTQAAIAAAKQIAQADAQATTATPSGDATQTQSTGAAREPAADVRAQAAKGPLQKATLDRFEAPAARSFVDYANPLHTGPRQVPADAIATPQAQTAGTAGAGGVTTHADGEEGGGAPAPGTSTPTAPNPGVTTRAVGEEGGGLPGGGGLTTQAVGEEGGGQPGGGTATTLAIGEEGGGFPGGGDTLTTLAIGEEGGAPPPGGDTVTTRAVGEEGGASPPGVTPPGTTLPGGDAIAPQVPTQPQAPAQPQVPVQDPVVNACQAQPGLQSAALQQFQAVFTLQIFQFEFSGQLPATGCMPAPRSDLSCAPAGKGLAKDPAGWPQGSVKTAGGYVVVPEGKDQAWSIYAPGQKPGDKPHTRVWGDPHVHEKDGTKWDFTKASDFVLPDGTRIHCKTTSETGQSVTKGLTLSNGHERIDIDGINTGSPKTGEMQSDGFAWRAQHAAAGNRDSFHLGGSDTDVRWFRERVTGGATELAEVTGATFDKAQNRYEQTVDAGKKFWVDPSLRPGVGAPEFAPTFQNALFQAAGALPPGLAGAPGWPGVIGGQAPFGQMDLASLGGFAPFGGLGRSFGDFSQVLQSLVALQAVMQLLAMSAQLQMGRQLPLRG